MRICIALSSALLLAEVIFAPFRRGTWHDGLGVVVSAAVSIAGALLYLRSRRGADRRDLQAWASARTLADLGELTARWLEGTIPSVPGYIGEPDPETAELVPVLAKLNRAGFVTTCSQPGLIEDEQRAAVEGFASWEVAARIETAAVHADLNVIVHDPACLPRWRYYYGEAQTVTEVNGQRFTAFGVQVPRRHIRDSWIGYGICHRDAVNALCGAWQVTVIDPEWGHNDMLWPLLAGAIGVTS